MENKNTYIIAEMACSHDGKTELAETIINAAAKSGADAVQFQVWKKEEIITASHPDASILQALELSQHAWRSLVDHVRSTHTQLDIIACIYEKESLDFCNEAGVDAFKIHAADITNLPLLRSVGSHKKRTDLSIGACSLDEILAAVEALKDGGCPDIWLMYGLQNFPTPPEDIDLRLLKNIGEITGLRIGYQDHSPPEELSAYTMCAAARGMGVSVLEKHITHDRGKKGADHQAALNPEEFTKFTSMIRELDKALSGGTIKTLTAAEQQYRKYSRKSLVACKAITKGTGLQANDFKVLRAETKGIDPLHQETLLGKTATRDIAEGEVFMEGDFQ
jgi:N,N'-diacetyllegionaminate synthase